MNTPMLRRWLVWSIAFVITTTALAQTTSAPTIVTHPADQVSTVGGNAAFTVVASGDALQYRWTRDRVPIAGATSATLSLTNLGYQDAGTYQVWVSSDWRMVFSSFARLTGANAAPTIQTQPESKNAKVGDSVSLSVVATGTGSLAYQWRRNGVPISGATSASFQIASAKLWDADYYDVIVYDGLSATRSDIVRVMVDPASQPALLRRSFAADLMPETASAEPVQRIVVGADGKYYITGAFDSIGGHRRDGLARLNSDLTLDTSFAPPALNGSVRTVHATSEGKVWIAGDFTTVDGVQRGLVAKLNGDGSVDTSFSAVDSGISGIVLALVPLGDGRVLVGGDLRRNSTDLCLVSIAAAGQVTSLQVPTDIEQVNSLVVQPDGKIVVAGSAPSSLQNPAGAVFRLNAEGAIDATFELGVSQISSACHVSIQADGNILFAAVKEDGTHHIIRLLPSGAPDAGFAAAGVFSPSGFINWLSLRDDGRIVLAGSGMVVPGGSSELLRLTASGTVDPSFAWSPGHTVAAIAKLDQGRLLAGGTITAGGNTRGLAVINADGTVDTTYTVSPRRVGTISDMTHLPDGAVLIAGDFESLGGVPSKGVARIEPDGTVNASFSVDRIGTGYRIIPQSDGRVLVHGLTREAMRTCLVRISPQGVLDTSYGTYEHYFDWPSRLFADWLLMPLNGSAPLALTPDGDFDGAFPGVGGIQQKDKTLVGSSVSTAEGSRALARMNRDGSPDQSFSSEAPLGESIRRLLVVQNDHILALYEYRVNAQLRKKLVRLTADGLLDTSFTFGLEDPEIDAVLPLGDGRYIISGTQVPQGSITQTPFIRRFNADGSLDTSFRVDGLETRARSLLARPDGTLYVGTVDQGLIRLQTTAAPTISAQPSTIETTPGTNPVFSVVAAGTLPLSYQWNFNGAPIAGANSSTLGLTNVQVAQAGVYTVTVTNAYGTVTSAPAVLKGPNALPVITANLQPVSAVAGAPLSLSVTATTTGTANYQWRRNGVPIAGATSATLNLGSASLVQNGAVFEVVVSDGMSATVSSPAPLSVSPAAYPLVARPDPAFAPTFDLLGGSIRKLHRASDGRVYAVGRFSRIGGVAAWNIVRLTSDAQVDSSFKAVATDGPIESMDVQPDGKVVVAGNFSRIGGREMQGLARLTAAGAVDWTFSPTENGKLAKVVRVQSDGRILVGGEYANFNGLVRLNPDGSRDAAFSNAYLKGDVYQIVEQTDGKLLVGGQFTGIGVVVKNLTRLNANGTVDETFTTGTGPSHRVRALGLLPDGRVIVAGSFASYNGTTVGGLVRLLSTGERDPSWTTGAGFTATTSGEGVDLVEVLGDGRLLVAGRVGTYNGTAVRQILRLAANGSIDSGFSAHEAIVDVSAFTTLASGQTLIAGGFPGNVQLLSSGGAVVVNTLSNSLFTPAAVLLRSLPSGEFLAFGPFTHVNGVARPSIARIKANGSLDETFAVNDLGRSFSPSSVVMQSDGRPVVATGTSLSRYNLNGTVDATFSPFLTEYGLVAPGSAFPLRGDRIACLATRASTHYIVVIGATGRFEAAFRAPEPVTDIRQVIEQPDGKLVVLGAFTTYAGGPVKGIVRLLTDGTRDTAFTASADGAVNAAVLQSDGKVVIAGDFLTINDTSIARIARLSANGTLDTTFNPGFGPNRAVRELLLQSDGKLLISGAFTSVAGRPGTAHVARLKADGTVDETFAALSINGSPASVQLEDDGSLLLSGGPGEASTFQQQGVARLKSAAGPVFVFEPAPATGSAGVPVRLAGLAVGGNNSIAYQWLKGGAAVTGATQSVLMLPRPDATDSGSYVLRATSGAQVIESAAAAVTITAAAPAFVGSKDTIAGFGGAVALGSRWPLTAPAVGIGSGPLTYQWTQNGTAIPGATRSTYQPIWQTSDIGSYAVTISNALGSVTSESFRQSVSGLRDWQWHQPQPQGNPLYAITYVNGRFLAGGARGTILVSEAGSGWVVRRLGVSESVIGLAYGNGAYVALTSFGGIWYSADAVSWVRRDSGAGEDGRYLRAIAHGSGGFVAVGDRGLVVRSTDGITWARPDAGAVDDLTDVAAGAGKFVVIGEGGRTYTSVNGTQWQSGTTLPESVLGVAFGGDRFIAITGDGAEYTSADGVAWNEINITSLPTRDIAYTSGQFLVRLDSHILRSIDGKTWTASETLPGRMKSVSAVAFGDSRWVFVCSASEALFSTSDLTNWTMPQEFPVSSVAGVAAGTTEMIAVGDSEYADIWSSADGANWRQEFVPNVLFPVYDVAFGGGRFVAVGGEGMVKTKLQGGTWTSGTTGTTRTLLGVSYANGRFFAGGTNGTLLRSEDGLSWTSISTGVTQSLYKVAHGNGVYVAVGTAGTVLSSTDGVTWATRDAGTLVTDVPGVVYAEGKFVLVTEGGSIRTSPDGVTWTARTNPLSLGFRALTYARDRFFALNAGNTDFIMSVDGVTWLSGQHGNSNGNVALTRFGDRIFAVGGGLTVVSWPLDVGPPSISVQPAAIATTLTGGLRLGVGASAPDPKAYQWFKDGYAVVGATNATLDVAADDTSVYTVRVSTEVASVMSRPAVLALDGRFARTLTAGASLSDESLVANFTVEGSESKQFLIRAIGPSLSDISSSEFLADPELKIFDTAEALVASNDNWEQATNATEMTSAVARLGLHPLPAGSKDAAILATFAPGTYRVQVSRAGTSGRVGLDIYEADEVPRLVYLSARGRVAPGKPLIQGLMLFGAPPGRSYLIRALGPSLGNANSLADPKLSVYFAGVVRASNDDWAGDASITALATRVGAMPLGTATKDAALELEPLTTGAYTIQVRGDTAGEAMVEVFEADDQRAQTIAPAIVSRPKDASAAPEGSASFGVVTVGTPAPAYQWSKDSVAINGATNAILTLSNVTTADAGTYSVSVTAGSTTLTASANLSVVQHHGADTNRDWRISLLELTRIIELYNTRASGARTGCYAVATGTSEDGFEPAPTRAAATVVTLSRYHSADMNRDGRISLSELTRVIELYNTRVNGARTGQYHIQSGTEDGYAPGAAAAAQASQSQSTPTPTAPIDPGVVNPSS